MVVVLVLAVTVLLLAALSVVQQDGDGPSGSFFC